ncbi:MAG: CDP-alcohol phosphatidyltransferase family protein [Gammaproteobacteria bacterium]|nr:CDP-alcohol phosphatidyltransferase family protein [Gammaproteobacteria bacterium]MDH3537712.1 CDP-alcohol phosphatidyltransferase family protein [Gammaproteobacteria bacterium]
MNIKREMLKIPNLISAIRILIAPVLFLLAFRQLETWFLGLLLFSAFTDVVDGFVARRFGMITPLGAHLDSWGDFTIYSTMAVCAWILWPDITRRELVYYAMILFSILLPALVGLVKFGKLTGYHTWSVKIAVFATFVGYVLLYAEIAVWPFILASVLCVIAGIEEILITLVLREERTDVRSILAALRDRGPVSRDQKA